jgi:hypothetical protein
MESAFQSMSLMDSPYSMKIESRNSNQTGSEYRLA